MRIAGMRPADCNLDRQDRTEPMHKVLLLLFSSCAFVFGASLPDESGAIATVQRLFDAMAMHDAAAARELFTPGATLVSVRANGAVSNSTSEQFVARWGAAK